jgi:tRNA modification GTPase
MKTLKEDTIAAISTPSGESGISIVRLSGKDAVKLAKKIFKPRKEKKLEEVPSFSTHFGFIVDPKSKEVIDEVIVGVMKAPATYTKEDVVEFNCHGGPVPVRRTLELLLSCGARLAEPGEFTKRAFLNGRIDLAQAEAVIDVIKAKTEEGLKAAVNQLKGDLSKKMHEITAGLTEACVMIEANIEFPEAEIEATDLNGIKKSLSKILLTINNLIRMAESGKLLREGVKTVIVGKPNVGKSSLLNELLDEERAIVTHIPGTTRDIIEESINIGGVAFVLTDTAGIRASKDFVEKKGIERSLKSLEEADLLLVIFDGSTGLAKEDLEIIKIIEKKNSIIIINKIDLKQKITAEKLFKVKKPVKISIIKKQGLEDLKKKMVESVLKKGVAGKENIIITNTRHKHQLEKAGEAIERAIVSIDKGLSEEFTAVDVREALDHIGEITGHVSTDDILNRIFSDFCIGK